MREIISMKQIKIEPKELTLYSNANPDTMLWDYRLGHWGLKFGKIKDICTQFGINCEKLDDCYKFTAPKLRMERLMEKLHFSRTYYWK